MKFVESLPQETEKPVHIYLEYRGGDVNIMATSGGEAVRLGFFASSGRLFLNTREEVEALGFDVDSFGKLRLY